MIVRVAINSRKHLTDDLSSALSLCISMAKTAFLGGNNSDNLDRSYQYSGCRSISLAAHQNVSLDREVSVFVPLSLMYKSIATQ